MNIEELHGLYLKCNSVCTDTRKLIENDIFFALKGENFNGNLFAISALMNGAAFAVVDDRNIAVDDRCILVDDALQTLQDLARFHRKFLNTKIIALTGSNGKTTTKELIHNVLKSKYRAQATKGNLNNHIGVPLTLLSLVDSTEFAIVEMGANNPGEIEFLCNIALPDYGYITNFGKAHLEGFGTIEGVIRAKSELYDHLIEHQGSIFINGIDSVQLKLVNTYAKTIVFNDPFTNDDNCQCIETNPFVKLSFKGCSIQSQLTGSYNFNNISAAVAIGNHFNVPVEQIKSAIESYVPVNNRSQLVTLGTNTIILDAYNANPTSMIATLNNFSDFDQSEKIAILGDMFELGQSAEIEHQAISDYASTLDLEAVYLVGKNFFKTRGNDKLIQRFETFEDFKNDVETRELKNKTIFIKGSRGMALERILESL